VDTEIDALVRVVEARAASESALDRLQAAVALVDARRTQHETILDRFVAAARRAGCSLSEIGATMGVSKQAAHQRFPAVTSDGGAWRPQASDTVRAAFTCAQQEARALGHNYLGTEHVLLGLLGQTDGLAAHALAALDVDREAVLSRIREVIGIGPPRAWESVGVTPRTKRALELARAQAKALGHRCIGTEHMLLGLVNLETGVAVQILDELRASPEAVRRQLAHMLDVDVERLSRPRRRRILRSH
jgi:hypothetical protein